MSYLDPYQAKALLLQYYILYQVKSLHRIYKNISWHQVPYRWSKQMSADIYDILVPLLHSHACAAATFNKEANNL